MYLHPVSYMVLVSSPKLSPSHRLLFGALEWLCWLGSKSYYNLGGGSPLGAPPTTRDPGVGARGSKEPLYLTQGYVRWYGWAILAQANPAMKISRPPTPQPIRSAKGWSGDRSLGSNNLGFGVLPPPGALTSLR